MSDKTVAELEAEIRAIREREKEELQAKLAATPIVRRYTILPHTQQSFGKDLMDDTCCYYYLNGEVVNLEEAKAAGHNIDRESGGAAYLYNTLSKKLVGCFSGGYIHVSEGWGNNRDENVQETWDAINKFLETHPEGGDITDIIKQHHAKRGM